jgi:hypothetical protein
MSSVYSVTYVAGQDRATVSSLQGEEIEPYANELFRAWKLGEAKKNNGVLLLIAPKERKVRIEVGYGLEGTLTDAVSSIIIANAITPRFKAGDFDGGVTRGVDDIVTALTTDSADGAGTGDTQPASRDADAQIRWGVPFAGGPLSLPPATAGLVVPLPPPDAAGQIIPVALGAIPIIMVVDTGSSLVSIDSVLADKLIARGEAVEGVGMESTLADGSTANNRVITINQLTIAGHAIYGVKAFVGGPKAMPLLGINVLNYFGKFSVDTVHKQLVLG